MNKVEYTYTRITGMEKFQEFKNKFISWLSLLQYVKTHKLWTLRDINVMTMDVILPATYTIVIMKGFK